MWLVEKIKMLFTWKTLSGLSVFALTVIGAWSATFHHPLAATFIEHLFVFVVWPMKTPL